MAEGKNVKKTEKKTTKKPVEKPVAKPAAAKPVAKPAEKPVEAVAKPVEKPEPKPAARPDENYVLVGQKPVMAYVVACLTSFNSGTKRVVVKARGRAISRAVDTSELLRRVFMKDVVIENIVIGTEELSSPDRPKSNVSSMEIVLVKK